MKPSKSAARAQYTRLGHILKQLAQEIEDE